MGKAGRFACIFVPMGLTILSLVCLILVFLGQREAHNSTTNQLYFFRVDTSISAPATIGNLSDFYQVGLWNYCLGDNTDGHSQILSCSKPEANYFFNLTESFNLSSGEYSLLPKAVADGEKVYKKVAHWMFLAYSIALAVTAAEIFVGIFAIFSRWGSCVTTIFSAVSTLFTVLAAITSTVLTGTLVGAFETLKHEGVHASFGTRMLVFVWLAAAFSLASGLFWTFSTCCCSGKSGAKRDGGVRRQGTFAEHLPYTHANRGYTNLGPQTGGAVPFGTDAMPMGAVSHAKHPGEGYEPYRVV